MLKTNQPLFLGKFSTLLQRSEGLSVQAFRDYWAGPHAQIAITMPGISRYTQNRVLDCLWTSMPRYESYHCDGIVELEFRDDLSIRAANQCDTGRNLLPEDEQRFLRGITLCQTQAGAKQISPPLSKVMLVAQLLEEADSALEPLRELLDSTGCAHYSIDVVSKVFNRPALAYESAPPHVFCTMWFDVGDKLSTKFDRHSRWQRRVSDCLGRGGVWRCDPLAIIDPGG